MVIFYLIALVPILIGAFLWYKNKEICWQEWLIGSVVSLGLAGIFNLVAVLNIHSQTKDTETWSGYLTQVEYHPRWVEEWIQIHTEIYACGTDSNGNTTYCTRTYTTIEHTTHPEHWEAERYFGVVSDSVDISQSLYNEIKYKFGNGIFDGGKQRMWHGGSFDGGDNNIYATQNETKFTYPAVINKSFENRIKATPNLFQFTKASTNLNIYSYPKNDTWNKSDRLLGTSFVLIDNFKFDQMNARLGSKKLVNVVFAGYGNKDAIYGQYQQAKFLGGKKNDLVLCFGGGSRTNKANWSFVFGWSEKEIVKRNLETILLNNPINDDILPLIEEEISKNYLIKDWKKFDYIRIQPKTWVYFVYIILVLIIQTGLWIYFHNNEFSKMWGTGIDRYWK